MNRSSYKKSFRFRRAVIFFVEKIQFAYRVEQSYLFPRDEMIYQWEFQNGLL